MTCDELRPLLELFALDDLQPVEQARIEGHLAGCADCRREADQARRRVGAIRDAAPGDQPVGSAETLETLLGKARTRAFGDLPARSHTDRRRRARVISRERKVAAPAWIPPATVAAVALLGLGLLLLTRGESPTRRKAVRRDRDAVRTERRVMPSERWGNVSSQRRSPSRFEPGTEPRRPPPSIPSMPARERSQPTPGAPARPPIWKGATPSVPAPGLPASLPLRKPEPGGSGATVSELARIVTLTGYAVYRRGETARWLKLLPGTRLLANDEIDTRGARVHLALVGNVAGDTILAPRTGLSLAGAGRLIRARLLRGKAYFDLPPFAQGSTLVVETSEGAVRVVGTRFEVRKLSRFVRVTVAEGRVGVTGAQGGDEVRVKANEQVTVREGRPSAPRSVDAAQALGWARKMVARSRRVAARFTFDRMPVDVQFLRGRVVPGSAFDRPGGSLRASPVRKGKHFSLEVALEKPASHIFKWSERMRLRFHYRLSVADRIKVQLHPVTAESNSGTVYTEFPVAEAGVWHTFDRPLNRFQRQFAAPVPEGARIINFYIVSGIPGRPQEMLIDNVELYEAIR